MGNGAGWGKGHEVAEGSDCGDGMCPAAAAGAVAALWGECAAVLFIGFWGALNRPWWKEFMTYKRHCVKGAGVSDSRASTRPYLERAL